jgi:hypothetical protein
MYYQSLVGSVVIVAEFGRKDHSWNPTTAIGKRLELLDVRTDSRTKLMVVKVKKCRESIIYNPLRVK